MTATKLYRVEFGTRFRHIAVLDLIFENIAIAVSSYEIASRTVHSEPEDRWQYLIYLENQMNQDEIFTLISQYIEGDISIFEEVPKDGVSEVQNNAKSMQIGSFYVSNSHLISQAPNDSIAIQIEAGRAFGTGEHYTTSGCLEMLSFVDLTPLEILDVGTGSGILAIGSKKLWKEAKVFATEIDQDALKVAKDNANVNCVAITFENNYALEDYKEKFDLIIWSVRQKS
jgi:ribosomal protein L11 methyltransferase